ncbi:MAG: TetR/AcrR family transcriptional regulator [Endomicrobiaceae bacterium]|jgi:AcrR family transcriptional regulator|nr:TetR/AcrR family transcriptional regulator [Candidatus Cloacimonadota bacterium]
MEKKQEIIETAKQVFRQYGLNKTTLEDIASRLNMKKNSLYYYFKSKNALVISVLEAEFKEFLDEQMQIIQFEESLKDKLNRFLTYRVKEAYKFLKDYNIFNNAENGQLHNILHKESEKLLKAELKVINSLLERYNLCQKDNDILSTIILSISQGFVYRMGLYNLSEEKIVEDIHNTVDMLFSGINLSS